MSHPTPNAHHDLVLSELESRPEPRRQLAIPNAIDLWEDAGRWESIARECRVRQERVRG